MSHGAPRTSCQPSVCTKEPRTEIERWNVHSAHRPWGFCQQQDYLLSGSGSVPYVTSRLHISKGITCPSCLCAHVHCGTEERPRPIWAGNCQTYKLRAFWGRGQESTKGRRKGLISVCYTASQGAGPRESNNHQFSILRLNPCVEGWVMLARSLGQNMRSNAFSACCWDNISTGFTGPQQVLQDPKPCFSMFVVKQQGAALHDTVGLSFVYGPEGGVKSTLSRTRFSKPFHLQINYKVLPYLRQTRVKYRYIAYIF